jgi:hypothetical protein
MKTPSGGRRDQPCALEVTIGEMDVKASALPRRIDPRLVAEEGAVRLEREPTATEGGC